MTILDINILLYAHDPESPQHMAARAWLDNLFNSPEVIGLPWATIWGFVRISTNQRIRPNPKGAAGAFQRVREWLTQPGVAVIEPGPHHIELLEQLVVGGQAAGRLVSDAVLAALAIENGATLASTDRDFARFPNLRWMNPLA